MKYNCVIILGATASGKTRLSIDLAKRLNGEIINLNGHQLSILSDLFKKTNPYKIFQNIAWLPEFLGEFSTESSVLQVPSISHNASREN